MEKDISYLAQITSYIKNNLKKGYTKDSLKWALISQGHSRLEVEKAVRQVDSELANRAPILKTKPEIKFELISDKINQEKSSKKSFWERLFG